MLRSIAAENLPLTMKEGDLGQYFEEFSPFEVKIAYNKKGVSLGKGQIIFPTRKTRQQALRKLTGNVVYNNNVIVIKPAH